MSVPLFSIKTGWLVLAAAGLGLAAGFLLRPGSATAPRGSPVARPAQDTPLGRRHHLPQTEARLEALRKAGSPSQQIAAALTFSGITSVEEIRDLLENSHRFPAHSAEAVAIVTLLKRWLELDAAGAVAYCRKNQAEFLPKLLANWSQDHPAEATAWVQAMPPGPAQKTAWLGLCEGVAARDPDKAWDMLGRTPGLDPRISGSELQSSIKSLVGRDVEKAIASLETMPPSLLPAAQEAIAVKLMKTDPTRAWAWVRKLPEPGRATLGALGVSLAADPAQAMALLKSLPGREQKWIANYFPSSQKLNSRDFSDLLRQDTALLETTRQVIAENVFSPDISKGSASAMELISLMSSEGQIKAIQNSVKQWARQGTLTLRAWVESLPEGPLRTAALEAQANYAPAEKAPGRTGPESLADEIKRDSYIQPSDPRLTQLTVEQLGEIMKGGRVEDNYYRQTDLLIKLGTVNSAVATAWLESTPIDAKTGPIAAQFSAQWAETDPAAAAEWVVKLPAGDLARTAAANVARQYHRYAPAEALVWLPQLPPGPVQDAARQAMKGP